MKRQVFAFATIGAALFVAAPGLASAEEAGSAPHRAEEAAVAPAAAAPSPDPTADPEQSAPEGEQEPPRPDSEQSPAPPSPEPTEDPRQPEPEPAPEPAPEPQAEETADAQSGGEEPAPTDPAPIEPAEQSVVQDPADPGVEAPGSGADAPPSVSEEGRQDGTAGSSGQSQPVNGSGGGAQEHGLARTGPDGLPGLALGGSALAAAGAGTAVLASRRRACAEGRG